MDATEHLPIVQLDPSCALEGLALSTETHWNQNEADWRFFLTTDWSRLLRCCRTHLIMPGSAWCW